MLPHDPIHYLVESALKLTNGFLSLVARGGNAVFVMEQTQLEGLLFAAAIELNQRWLQVPSYGSMELEFALA